MNKKVHFGEAKVIYIPFEDRSGSHWILDALRFQNRVKQLDILLAKRHKMVCNDLCKECNVAIRRKCEILDTIQHRLEEDLDTIEEMTSDLNELVERLTKYIETLRNCCCCE